jgi:hypothetical protein
MHTDHRRSPASRAGRAPTRSDRFDPAPPIRLPVDSETGWLLAQGIRAIHLSGDDAERESAYVIRSLRADPRAAADTAEQWIELNSSDASLRWSLVYLLSEIEDVACRDPLSRQALRQIPKDAAVNGGCEQASDYEELVAVMAIEGLGKLAKSGDSKSVNVLKHVVARQKRRSLRQPAVAALLAARTVSRASVERLLPKGERYLLRLREANEEDLGVDLAHPNRDKKPFRRATSPRPSPTVGRGGSSPRADAAEESE